MAVLAPSSEVRSPSLVIYQAANLDHLNCTDLLIADPAPTMETTKKSDPPSNTMDDYHLGSKLT